ncbi:MAG: hypothetical protein GVY13_18390 [Alphaproteobacteria bacterium]|jgi:LPS-assembly lipoprotein|nr:hypothetical protein [Alphaproteobacteria bacterium]
MSSRERLCAAGPPGRRAVLRGLLAGLAGAGLAGCGFRPLYGRHGSDGAAVHDALSAVSVGIIPDREGQILRNELIARLNPAGRPRDPRYRLDVGLREERQDIGLTAIDTITRVNLILRADVTLVAVESGEPVTREQVTAIAGYEVLDDEVATLSLEIDARRRGLVELAERIRIQLAMALAAAEPAGAAGQA